MPPKLSEGDRAARQAACKLRHRIEHQQERKFLIILCIYLIRVILENKLSLPTNHVINKMTKDLPNRIPILSLADISLNGHWIRRNKLNLTNPNTELYKLLYPTEL